MTTGKITVSQIRTKLEEQKPGKKITMAMISKVIGAHAVTISSWEKEKDGKIPDKYLPKVTRFMGRVPQDQNSKNAPDSERLEKVIKIRTRIKDGEGVTKACAKEKVAPITFKSWSLKLWDSIPVELKPHGPVPGTNSTAVVAIPRSRSPQAMDISAEQAQSLLGGKDEAPFVVVAGRGTSMLLNVLSNMNLGGSRAEHS